jgi:hypothetical protein
MTQQIRTANNLPRYTEKQKIFKTGAFCLFMGTSPKNCVLLGGTGNMYIEVKDDSKIKRRKNIDRHSPRPIPNVCHLPDLPWFSLQTSFEVFSIKC